MFERLQELMERVGAGTNRDVWPNAPRTPAQGDDDDDTPEAGTASEAPEVVRWPAAESSGAPNGQVRNHTRDFSDRGKIRRSVEFLQYMLRVYDIEAEAGGRVAHTALRLERAVERLWQNLEEGMAEREMAARRRHG